MTPPGAAWPRQEFRGVYYLISRNRFDEKFRSRKKGAGRAKVPVEKKIEKNFRFLPNFEILDMDSIMLVIGLVEMLNFLKKMAIYGV